MISLRLHSLVRGSALLFFLAASSWTNAGVSVSYALGRTGEIFGTVNSPTDVVHQSYSNSLGAAGTLGYAQYGVLKVASEAVAPDSGAAFSQSQARFSDALNITSDGLTGSSGSAFISVWYHWNLGITGWPDGSYAIGDLVVTAGDRTAQVHETISVRGNEYSGEITDSGGHTESIPQGPLQFSFWLPVTFGSSFSLAAEMGVRTNAAGYTIGATAYADAMHSAYWGGISEVRDAAGNGVAFDVTSASGTNYRNSFVPAVGGEVPEPSSLALVLTGVVGLGFRARRKHTGAVGICRHPPIASSPTCDHT